MNSILLAVALMAAAPAPVPPSGGAGAQPPIRIFDLLDRDDRLRKPITLQKSAKTMADLVYEIARQTKAEMVVQGDYLSRPIVVLVDRREARDIMTDIAIAAKGAWVKRRGVYMLLQDVDIAGLILGAGSKVRRDEAAKLLASSMTEDQMTILRAAGRLPMARLQPIQKRWLAVAILDAYYQEPNLYPRSVFTDYEGAEIWWVPGNETSPECIGLAVPRVTEEGADTVPFLLAPLKRTAAAR